MATHVLPTAYEIDGNSNEGGWDKTDLRGRLQSGGEIYNKFPSSLTGAITKVNKLNNIGGEHSSQSAAGTTTNDAFWLLSYSELHGTGGYYSYAPIGEGTAYQWCIDKNIDGDNTNSSLVYKTRAGETAGFSDYCINVDDNGAPKDYNLTYYRFGVTPCFCF